MHHWLRRMDAHFN